MRAHLRQCGCRFSGPAPSEKIGLISATACRRAAAAARDRCGCSRLCRFIAFWWSDVSGSHERDIAARRACTILFFQNFQKKSHCPARSGQKSQQPSAVRLGSSGPCREGSVLVSTGVQGLSDSTLTCTTHLYRTFGRKHVANQGKEAYAAPEGRARCSCRCSRRCSR